MKWFQYTTYASGGFFLTSANSAAPVVGVAPTLVCTLTKVSVGTLADTWSVVASRPIAPGENPNTYYPEALRPGQLGHVIINKSESHVYLSILWDPDSLGPANESTYVSISGPNLEGVDVGDEFGYSFEGGNSLRFQEPVLVGTQYTVTIYGGEPGENPEPPSSFWTSFIGSREII